jgi:hypothetical protein
MENEEERHKFEAKWKSDEKVTSKTVKSGARVSICGPQMVNFGPQMVNFGSQTMQPRTRAPETIFYGPQGSICGPKESRQMGDFSLTS